MKIKLLIIMTTIMLSNLQAQVDTVFVPYLGQVDIQFTFQLSKMNDRYLYNYRIHSFETSKQDIRRIRIQYKGDCIYDISSPLNWFSFRADLSPYARGRNFIAWGPDDYAYLIKAGNSLEGFQISSSGLPFIADYVVQGYFPTPSIEFGEEEPVIIGSMNTYENSKKGKTIGPACSPDPFVPVAFLDTLISYTNQSRALGWITNQPTADKYEGYFSRAQAELQRNDIRGARVFLDQVLRDVQSDSGVSLTSEAYALLRYNTEYLLGQLPEPPNPYLTVKLTNSRGELIPGGYLQYYEGGWKPAEDHGDGTFTVRTELASVKLRMIYEHGVQEKSNVPVKGNTVIFQTVLATVKVSDLQGRPLNDIEVRYYSGGWYSIGLTVDGVVTKELLPLGYKFRVIKGKVQAEKTQDLSIDSRVEFSLNVSGG